MALFDTQSDEELLSLIATNDQVAFDAIYQRHAEFLYRYAYNILEDTDECSDAVQDIFIWLWTNRKNLHVNHLKSYLSAAIKYRLTRSIQTSRRREAILAARPFAEDAYLDDATEVRELQELIQTLVGQLPPRAREVFRLSRQEYLSNKEIAKKLNISEKTVENQMTIALRKLREGLGRLQFWVFFL